MIYGPNTLDDRAQTLSMDEFEKLLDDIVRSKHADLEKSRAARELFKQLIGDSKTDHPSD